MAENIKRRVAAARLAVAFAAAGAIAGGAWAQASSQPPTAQTSASDYLLKAGAVNSTSILNGSLLFKDFKKGQIPSLTQFNKLSKDQQQFKKATNANIASIKGELDSHKAQIDGIKGELISSYVKLADADARYIKLSDDVVRGDGSVFTASQLMDPNAQVFTHFVSVPGLLQVDVLGQEIRITNTSGSDLGHTEWGVNNDPPAGTLKSGDSIECFLDSGSTENIQFFSWGAQGLSATLSASHVNDGQKAQNTVQILIGL